MFPWQGGDAAGILPEDALPADPIPIPVPVPVLLLAGVPWGRGMEQHLQRTGPSSFDIGEKTL